jgi:putative ABC transport system substrate-binding protein
MKRRDFIALLGGAAVAWPFVARAAEGRPRIAYLGLGSAQDALQTKAGFTDGLRALGYVEVQSVDIDYRHADGDTTRLESLAQELIAFQPAVVLAGSPSSAMVVKSIAPSLPVVCPLLSDAAVPGLVASYSHPGGSVTGVSQNVEGMTSKLLELALDIVPGVGQIGFLSNRTGASMNFFAQEIAAAAHIRGVRLLIEEVDAADDLASAFDRLVEQRAQTVIIPQNGLFNTQGAHIVQLALGARLPTIFAFVSMVELGGLAGYGVDSRENSRRAASYVDKILKGARPGDLPVEFPTKLLLAVNLKTAKALGLEVPPTLVARADEVIE